MRKRTVTSVKNACWRLCSKIVRSLGACEHCGKRLPPAELDGHHVYGRGISNRLYLDLRNICCLCTTCHYWAEGNPIEFTDWFRWHRPTDAEYLKAQHAKGPMVGEDKMILEDYLEREQELKEELKSGYSQGPV